LVVSRFDEIEAARYGFAGPLAGGNILLSEQGAQALRLAVGERIRIDGHLVVVAGVFSSFGDVAPRVLMDVSHPLAALDGTISSVSVNASDPAALRGSLAKRHAQLAFELQTELRETAMATFDRTFTITTVLIFIALVVAGIGVYVAVTTLRLNKRTGSGVLLSVGVNRAEDVAMDLALGVGIGAIAVLLAVPLGVAFGWILCSVINPRAFGWTVELQLGWQAFAGPIFWGLLAAALAGVLRIGRFEAGSVHAPR
jgi:putative ABC transport system permease protein